MREFLQNTLLHLADAVTAAIPRARPGPDALATCKLVSHRGEHDNHLVFENTLAAFRAARDAGVWGIECDLRWTRDRVPVVMHDADATRVFGDPWVIARHDFAELRARLPLVPSLAELLAEFGGNMHLMLELKELPDADDASQSQLLAGHLEDLQPVRDFHFLALDPALFEQVSFAPPACFLPVAEFQVAALSRLSIDSGFGGLTGHYLLLTETLRQRHEAAGQAIGTGHIGSKNALFREINRGVEWIFSNDAVAMQQLLNQHR